MSDLCGMNWWRFSWFFADALWRANLSKFQKKSKGLDLLWFTIAVSLSSVACSWVWSSTNTGSFDIGPLSTWECTESDTHALFSTAQSYHPLDPLGRSEVCPHLRLNRLGCNLLLSHYLACAHPHRKMIGNTAETGKFRVSEKWDRSRDISACDLMTNLNIGISVQEHWPRKSRWILSTIHGAFYSRNQS